MSTNAAFQSVDAVKALQGLQQSTVSMRDALKSVEELRKRVRIQSKRLVELEQQSVVLQTLIVLDEEKVKWVISFIEHQRNRTRKWDMVVNACICFFSGLAAAVICTFFAKWFGW